MGFREAKKSLEALSCELGRYDSVNGLPVRQVDTEVLRRNRLLGV